MLFEGASQLARGQRPKASDLLLTPANAKRIADQLAHLRGAAMKVGQLLSMEGGDLLPEALTDILGRLRADADPMPEKQLRHVLCESFGENWQDDLLYFSFAPIAAASIGQVHRAITMDGTELAIKIQYPGVRKSINSDVDNVATLLKLSGLLPRGIDYGPLLEEAKAQLHSEADYEQEAQALQTFSEFIADTEYLTLPTPYLPLCDKNVLAMTYMKGVPIESLAEDSEATRNHVISVLFELLFREVFDYQFVQTDPNFANFQYDEDTHSVVLLDFGAARSLTEEMVSGYRQLVLGVLDKDLPSIKEAALQIGFFDTSTPADIQDCITQLCYQACESLHQDAKYDFGSTDLADRMREEGLKLTFEHDFWEAPPADCIFLHRKIGGLFLLAVKLKANLNVRKIAEQLLFTV